MDLLASWGCDFRQAGQAGASKAKRASNERAIGEGDPQRGVLAELGGLEPKRVGGAWKRSAVGEGERGEQK